MKVVQNDCTKNELPGNGGQINKRTETEQNSESTGSINIQKFKGILGNVQAGHVQTGDHASIHEQDETEKKKKGILRKLWWIIATVVGFLAALLTCLYYLGWLEPIKVFIYKLFAHY